MRSVGGKWQWEWQCKCQGEGLLGHRAPRRLDLLARHGVPALPCLPSRTALAALPFRSPVRFLGSLSSLLADLLGTFEASVAVSGVPEPSLVRGDCCFGGAFSGRVSSE